jgi:uncharacterized membrane protein
VGTLRLVLLVAMAIFYVVSGVLHFVKMDYYLTLMPPQLPWHRGLVILSGIAEIVLGIAVLVPATRVWAAWGLVALLVAVFPANIYGAVAHVPNSGGYARLPLQAVFIAWAWWYTRP